MLIEIMCVGSQVFLKSAKQAMLIMSLKWFVLVNIHSSSDQSLCTMWVNALLSARSYIPVDIYA